MESPESKSKENISIGKTANELSKIIRGYDKRKVSYIISKIVEMVGRGENHYNHHLTIPEEQVEWLRENGFKVKYKEKNGRYFCRIEW